MVTKEKGTQDIFNVLVTGTQLLFYSVKHQIISLCLLDDLTCHEYLESFALIG